MDISEGRHGPINVAQTFRKYASESQMKERVAAFECSPTGPVNCMTYADLWCRAETLAKGIRRRLRQKGGIAQFDYQKMIAACYMDRSVTWYVVYVACAALGLPLAAMGTDLPNKEQQDIRNAYIREKLEPCIIIVEDISVRGEGMSGAESLDGLMALGEEEQEELLIPSGRDLILGLHFTGGTTTVNYSKCVVITHGMVLHEFVHYKRTVVDFIPEGTSVCMLHNGLVHWSSAAYGILSIGISLGGMVALPGSDYTLQKDPARFMELASLGHGKLSRGRRTLVCGFVPTVLSTLRRDDIIERIGVADGKELVVISWGEKLSQELADEWNADHITLLDLLIASEYWLSFYAKRSKGDTNAKYKVTDGAVIDVDNVDDNTPEGGCIMGELLLGGDMVTPYGYYIPADGDEQAERNNREKFIVKSGIRFYRTNDLVRINADKTIEFIGRLGNFVKLGGAFHDTVIIQNELSEELGGRECHVVNYKGELHFFVVHSSGEDRINGSRLLAAVRSRIPLMDVEHLHLLPANYELPRNEGTGKLSGPLLVESVSRVDMSEALKRKGKATMEDIEDRRIKGTGLMMLLALPICTLFTLSPIAFLKAFISRVALLPWILPSLLHPSVAETISYYVPFGRFGGGILLTQVPGPLGWYIYCGLALLGVLLSGRRKPIRALCWVPVSLLVQGPTQLLQDVEMWGGYFGRWGVDGVSRWYLEQLYKYLRSKSCWTMVKIVNWVYCLMCKKGEVDRRSYDDGGGAAAAEEYKACSRCRRMYPSKYGCSDTFYNEPWNWYCEDCWWTHIGRINETFGNTIEAPIVHMMVGSHTSSSTCGSDTPSRGEVSPSGSVDGRKILDESSYNGNSVEHKVVRILTSILGEPPTSETTLMGLSSLNIVLLTAQINKEFDASLSVAEVMNSGTSLQSLSNKIESAISVVDSGAVEPLHTSPASGKEYAVYTNESLWTSAVCDWLLESSAPLETTRVQSAVEAIVKKHPSLRSYPIDADMDSTISILTRAVGYFHLRGWGHETRFGRWLSWCVYQLWPRISVRSDAGGPMVIEYTFKGSGTRDAVKATEALWREYPFEPPFQVFLMRPENAGANVNYLYIKTTHLLSDGYCVLPLVMDFERFINKPEKSPVELNPYRILEKRLKDTFDMRPGTSCGYNFEQPLEEWHSWDRGTIKRRTLWLEKSTVEALAAAGREMAVSIEVMVLAVVLLSLSRFQKWSWVSLNLMQTLRDEVEYCTQDMVAFFSDYRDMGLFPTHSSSSVNDFVYELSTRIRMRKWKSHDYTLFQFNEAYFDCHDVVRFVRESVRDAIRDLT
ncbi:hypothetical protein FOL47_006145 [Perkinsus chesapeaki]|uniref:Uncharacterized protein n=1 Tax=Perkinsus chesapeaki TaxID=330153 RepID=A0A7J6LV09_PERCH|nr:hypothetical protein FOL47_006145 [Perkinsus chesapeaki]